MSNVNLEGLPPEMQERIASIIEGAKQKAVQPTQPPVSAPPVARQPSLMDHTIALRQEVDALRQQTAAMAQVVDAVGQAVGSLYQMFQQQTEVTDFSTGYQAPPQEYVENDY